MVEVTLRVRPKNGYHFPNKIRTIKLESHTRLEELLKQINDGSSVSSSCSSSPQDSALYLHGRELPLNSSIASHNLDDGVILETCKSPAISAVLSAVLKDFDAVKRIPENERTRANLMTVLQIPAYLQEDIEDNQSFWETKRWDDESIKNRIICLATMKKVLQKDDRYAIDIPCCSDIQTLHRHIQPALDRQQHSGPDGNGVEAPRKKWNSIGNLFTPSTKRNGKPSTIYTLLEHKLTIQIQIAADFVSTEQGSEDPIEEFVRMDSLRHADELVSLHAGRNHSSSARRKGVQSRKSSTSTITNNDATRCRNNQNNNPMLSDEYVRTPPGTPTKSKQYCPQYASGPFAILCALFEAQSGKHKNSNGRRQLSLSENQLKILAQPRCRSNLYDRQMMRGSRNAFTCMESMAKRNFVRKEIIREGEERWALLPEGNKMAEACLMFEKAANAVFPSIEINQSNKCASALNNDKISMIVDNREDVHFRERLMNECRENGISIVERELPTGDYLFVQNGNIIPLIIERKSWSDLADSVLAKGKAHRRLDCVRVGTNYASCPRQNCQLCKMKRSGCTQVMFIIEGAKCRGSDLNNNNSCNERHQCQACKALMERHGTKVTHEALEIVLNRLQAEHGCFIHFTQSYNQTISSLFAAREILSENNCYAARMMQFQKSKEGATLISNESGIDGKEIDGIPYDIFTANVRDSASHRQDVNLHNGDILEWKSETFVRVILQDLKLWQSFLHKELLQTSTTESKESRKRSADAEIVQISNTSKRPRCGGDLNQSIEVIELNESQNDIDVEVIDSDDESSVELLNAAPTCGDRDDVIELNDSQDSIQIVDVQSSFPIQCMTQEQCIDKILDELKADCSDTHCLLMINDMENLEIKVLKDINEKWQECYRLYESQDPSSFYDMAVTQLSEMKNSGGYPYLVSNSFMKVILWVQIKLGLRVRTVYRQKIVADLKDRWTMSSSKNAKLPNSEANDISSSRAVASNPSATSQRSPTSHRHAPSTATIPYSHSSTSKTMKCLSEKRAVAIEARLRRFRHSQQDTNTDSSWNGREAGSIHSESPSHYISKVAKITTNVETRDSGEWKCDTCTYLNTASRTECEMCRCSRSSNCDAEGNMYAIDVAHTKHEAAYDISSEYENFKSNSISNDAGSWKSETKKSNIKCGACGLEGHNRASATCNNCPAYFQEDEIRRREEKQRKIREKAIIAEQEYQALQEEEARVQIRQEELKRQIEEMNRDLLRTSEIRTAEIERRRKKALSARRRADRERL